MLTEEKGQTFDIAHNGEEGRQCISAGNYELILINAPLSDEPGEKLAQEAADSTTAGVILFVRAALESETEERLMPYGVFVLPKPLSGAMFTKVVRLSLAASHRLKGFRNQTDKLHQELENTRLIHRAKGILMEYLSMTEPQAHKYLEKQAMDLRITKTEVAKRLLSTYEN